MLQFVFYTNSVSAHQLPLAREIVARVGAENYRYVYTGERLQGGGQEVAECESWIVQASDARCEEWLENCEVLLCDVRDIDLIERRAAKGLRTFYVSERWFKPIEIKVERKGGQWCFHLPGRLRMLVPGYRRMAKRFVKWLKTDPKARYLAVGPWAKRDMMWMGVSEEKIIPWGYFVAPGSRPERPPQGASANTPYPFARSSAPPPLHSLRILWVGRMLDWKRVDTIVRAVARANVKLEKEVGVGEERGVRSKGLGVRFQLTLVGEGPEKAKILRIAEKLQKKFNTPLSTSTSFPHLLPPVPIAEVRNLMREHDVYVLASNAQEGWGAALNEALEEGMIGLGTHEAGASAALLPEAQRFHAGDVAALARLLEKAYAGELRPTGMPVDYTAAGAAERLMAYVAD